MADRGTVINGLRRIGRLKGALPINDLELIRQAADMLEEDGQPAVPQEKPRTWHYTAYECGSCGKPVNSNATHCQYCGRKIAWAGGEERI